MIQLTTKEWVTLRSPKCDLKARAQRPTLSAKATAAVVELVDDVAARVRICVNELPVQFSSDTTQNLTSTMQLSPTSSRLSPTHEPVVAERCGIGMSSHTAKPLRFELVLVPM